MNNKLISLIVPVYNTNERKLEKAVSSAVSQEYIYEIIIVDDGSRDGCAKYIDKLAIKYPDYIRVIHKSNAGVSSARNTGLELAKGEFVAFLDADDELEADYLKTAVDYITKDGSGVVFGSMKYISISGGEQYVCVQDILDGSIVLRGKEIDAVKGSLFNADAMTRVGMNPAMYVSNCAALYRRSLIGKTRFRENIVISEDRIFNYEILCKCDAVSIAGDCWYRYCQDESSSSQRLRPHAREELLETALYLREILADVKSPLYEDVLLGIAECFQQTICFSVLRRGFRKATGISKRAFVRSLLEKDVYQMAFKSLEAKTMKLRLLRFLFLKRLVVLIVACFTINQWVFDLKHGRIGK